MPIMRIRLNGTPDEGFDGTSGSVCSVTTGSALSGFTTCGEVLQFSKKTGKFVFSFDGEENMYDDFYDAFDEIISLVKTKAEDYIDL